jgi:hypothetical protein
MSFEAYDPTGPKTRSNDPILSIYTDGNSRINVGAMERWFEGVERVRLLVDEEENTLAFDREAESDRATLSISRRGNGGGDVHTTGALKSFGFDEESHRETAHRELREHEETGYIIADISGLPGFDADDAGDHKPAPKPNPDRPDQNGDLNDDPEGEGESENAEDAEDAEDDEDDDHGGADDASDAGSEEAPDDQDDQDDESDATRTTVDDDPPPELRDEYFDTTLSEIAQDYDGIGQSTIDRLARAGYETLADIRTADDSELTEVSHVGPTTVQRIRECVDDFDPEGVGDDADADRSEATVTTIDVSEHDGSPPEAMDEGSVYAVAQHFDTLDEVAEDLQVSVERAAAILVAHPKDLLVQVDVGDREVIDE